MRAPLLIVPLLLAACGERLPSPRLSGEAERTLPNPLRAVGTEPFWAAVLDGDRLTYRTPENQAGTSLTVRRGGSPGGTIVSGTLAGAPLRMRIAPGPCSDGMSDVIYPYAVELTIGSDARRGCARPESAAEPSNR